MSEAFLRGALRLCPRASLDDPNAFVRGDVALEAPVEFEYSSGGKQRDLVGTEFASIYLLSDRALNIFTVGGFRGFGTYPVTCFGKSSNALTGLHGLVVHGRCGKLNKVTKTFDATTWDGSDFFVAEGTGVIFVVERVRQAIVDNGLKNFELRFAGEYR